MHRRIFTNPTSSCFARLRYLRVMTVLGLLLCLAWRLSFPWSVFAAGLDKGRLGEGPIEEQRAVGVHISRSELRPYVPAAPLLLHKNLTGRSAKNTARLYVIHLWATWCEPCKAEFPFLKRMFHDGRYRDAQLMMVALQSPEEALQNFLDGNHASMPPAPLFVDDAASLLKQLKLSKLPITLLVDSHWVVRQAFSGPITDRLDELAISMDHFLAPMNLSSAGGRGVATCMPPPCVAPSYFMHNALMTNDAQRWDRRSSKFTKTSLSLPLRNQPNLLYLFSPSCVHCGADLTMLQKVADGWQHSKSKQASIILMSVTEDTERTANFLARQPISYNNMYVVHTSSNDLAEHLKAAGGSLMLIMNRQGYVRNAYVGSLSDQRLGVTESLISASQGQ